MGDSAGLVAQETVRRLRDAGLKVYSRKEVSHPNAPHLPFFELVTRAGDSAQIEALLEIVEDARLTARRYGYESDAVSEQYTGLSNERVNALRPSNGIDKALVDGLRGMRWLECLEVTFTTHSHDSSIIEAKEIRETLEREGLLFVDKKRAIDNEGAWDVTVQVFDELDRRALVAFLEFGRFAYARLTFREYAGKTETYP